MVRPSVDTEVILDAAAELIAWHGWDRLRMDDIAARAGVAKGVLYLRFASKDELLAAVIDREVVLATRATVRLVEDDPRGGLLSRQFVHSLAALHSRPALLHLYRDGTHLERLTHRGDHPARLRLRAVIGAEYITSLQADGLVSASMDAGALATNLTLWNYGLAARADADDLEHLIEGFADLIARAVDAVGVDLDAGKRSFARFADALIRERSER